MANAIMDKDPVVEPKEAPPVPNKALYIARRAAISVRTRSRRIIFPINAHGADEQQLIKDKGENIKRYCTILSSVFIDPDIVTIVN